MTAKLVYSRLARMDLEEIFLFIAADNPTRAGSYVAEIETACETLSTMPMIGTARPDILPGLRILALWRRVIVAYRILPEQIEILRVFTAGRDYAAIMST